MSCAVPGKGSHNNTVRTLEQSLLAAHYRDLQLSSTLSMAREFISDYADTNSGDRRVVPEFLGKQRLSSEVRIGTFKKSR